MSTTATYNTEFEALTVLYADGYVMRHSHVFILLHSDKFALLHIHNNKYIVEYVSAR